MQGVVRDTGQPITLSYEQGMSSDMLETHIDGEFFKGRAVMLNNTAMVGTAFGSAYAGLGTAYSSATVVGSTTSGDFVAKLFGSKGSLLTCELKYADPTGFTPMGGFGVCLHSDGRVVDVGW